LSKPDMRCESHKNATYDQSFIFETLESGLRTRFASHTGRLP
jgi:hypothetical protein